MKRRILDLFCGAGLVAEGLMAAGWEPTGVDIDAQPNYPAGFIQADALSLDLRFVRSFDAIWASPPCLRETDLAASARREQRAHGCVETWHPDLITPARAMLRGSGLPYVIENVSATKLLRDPITLCGSMFGLGAEDQGRRYHLERHRKFETNWPLQAPCACRHAKPVIGVYGGHARVRAASAGGRGTKDPWSRPGIDLMNEAMGVARRYTGEEISQGIPPAYARYIGAELMAHLDLTEGRPWFAGEAA